MIATTNWAMPEDCSEDGVPEGDWFDVHIREFAEHGTVEGLTLEERVYCNRRDALNRTEDWN